MSKEQIAIIGGTGDQGKGLALRWAWAGFPIRIGSRSGERAAVAAAEMRALLTNLAEKDCMIDGLQNSDAAAGSAIIVLTVPLAAQIPTLKEISPSIQAGSLLIDVTVPLEAGIGGKAVRTLGIWAGSAAEQCAQLAPAGIQVVSAFHNVGAAALANLSHDVDCDVIVCGDEKRAKQRSMPLVEAIAGCRYVDGGALANSRTVEALTALLIGFNIRYKVHTGIRITGIKNS